jgi:hypothetical protein
MLIILVVVVVLFLMCNFKNKEDFYFRSPPLAYDRTACERMCDNTDGCQSSYYDPVTRQCWMNSYFKYGDLYYPYVNNTYYFTPSRFRWGKYYGASQRDVEGNYIPKLKNRAYK